MSHDETKCINCRDQVAASGGDRASEAPQPCPICGYEWPHSHHWPWKTERVSTEDPLCGECSLGQPSGFCPEHGPRTAEAPKCGREVDCVISGPHHGECRDEDYQALPRPGPRTVEAKPESVSAEQALAGLKAWDAWWKQAPGYCVACVHGPCERHGTPRRGSAEATTGPIAGCGDPTCEGLDCGSMVCGMRLRPDTIGVPVVLEPGASWKKAAKAYREDRNKLAAEIEKAVLSAVHLGNPCPFCLARTDNVWPYVTHFKTCIADGVAPDKGEVPVTPKAPDDVEHAAVVQEAETTWAREIADAIIDGVNAATIAHLIASSYADGQRVERDRRRERATAETCEHGYYTLDALLTASKIAKDKAIIDERAAIAAWLRTLDPAGVFPLNVATLIAEGAHLKGRAT